MAGEGCERAVGEGAVSRGVDAAGRGTAAATRGAPASLAARVVASLVGVADAPPGSLLARYPELAEVRWRRGGLALRVGGWCLGRRTVAGITLGRTVFLERAVGWPPALLLHELAHVRQFAQARDFPLAYVWESLRRGYTRNRFEREADGFAAQVLAERPPVHDSRRGVPHDLAARRAGAVGEWG
jgi:hypothetical protein